MTDSETYYPMVYCERCKHYIIYDGVLAKLKFPFFLCETNNESFWANIKNANHDCKDYEGKDERD
jgi:hypothetical protein